MNRREFLRLTAAMGLTAATTDRADRQGLSPQPTLQSQSPAALKLGCQRYGANSDEALQYYARYGVTHIAARPEGAWTVENITKMRKRASAHGITVESAHIPIGPIWDRDRGTRDRAIDEFCAAIKIGAEGGYSVLLYGVGGGLKVPFDAPFRTGSTLGRGGASYSTFEMAKVGPAPDESKAVSSEEMWDALACFLDRAVPVAETCRARIACHPEDPPYPPGFRGTAHALASVEGLKRFVSMADSDYHGLNFCQGTVSEMLDDPRSEICDIIRWFGARRKIHNVHLRNIRGRRDSFRETYPDEGNVDMLMAMRAYKEIGYSGMIMPDHLPDHPDDAHGRESFAFAYGYIRALIQAVNAEPRSR